MEMTLKKTGLAIELSKLEGFIDPDPSLEQYPTDSEIAANILWKAYMAGHLTTVADLGAGTGILGLGAALLGAKRVYLIEKDKSALDLAKQNQKELESRYGKLPLTYIKKDIIEFKIKVDTVIMNPPFGVQTQHADKEFLKKAFEVATNIYSLHKIESKEFIEKLAYQHDFQIKEIMQFKFPVVKSMAHHTQIRRVIKVGCWIMERV